jgi:hypothetical protein
MIGMNIDAPTTRGDEATKPVSKRAEVAIKNTGYSLSHPGIRLCCSLLVNYFGNGVI